MTFHDPYEPRGRWYRIVATIGFVAWSIAVVSMLIVVVICAVVLLGAFLTGNL